MKTTTCVHLMDVGDKLSLYGNTQFSPVINK